MMRDISKVRSAVVVTALFIGQGFSSSMAAEPTGAPIQPTPPFASPDIKPTFCDWLTATPIALAKKIAKTDPLQKPPFAGQPADSLKGMAAGIRAVQLDAPNRAKAAAYLGTVDCVTYPQAQKMLIATMQEDPSEEVRYEAVMALRMMMSRGCCNMDTMCECQSCGNRKRISRESERHSAKTQRAIIHEAKGHAKIEARKANRTAQETRYDCCRGCCNEKVMKALSDVAFGKDDQCCWTEPSERVRQAAEQGLCLCCTSPAGMYMGEPLPTAEPVPPAQEVEEVVPSQEQEATPDLKTPEPKSTSLPPAPITKAKVTNGPPVIAALNGYCIVGLKDRQFIAATEEFSSVYEEHTYYFASIDAKMEFDSDPSRYAPAYGGIDPVVWLERHQAVNGQFLREFEGRFYLFSDKDKWETFKSSPSRFVLRKADGSRTLASNKNAGN